jgi:hypothetical protein
MSSADPSKRYFVRIENGQVTTTVIVDLVVPGAAANVTEYESAPYTEITQYCVDGQELPGLKIDAFGDLVDANGVVIVQGLVEPPNLEPARQRAIARLIPQIKEQCRIRIEGIYPTHKQRNVDVDALLARDKVTLQVVASRLDEENNYPLNTEEEAVIAEHKEMRAFITAIRRRSNQIEAWLSQLPQEQIGQFDPAHDAHWQSLDMDFPLTS